MEAIDKKFFCIHNTSYRDIDNDFGRDEEIHETGRGCAAWYKHRLFGVGK
jgi:hypothetical protein